MPWRFLPFRSEENALNYVKKHKIPEGSYTITPIYNVNLRKTVWWLDIKEKDPTPETLKKALRAPL